MRASVIASLASRAQRAELDALDNLYAVHGTKQVLATYAARPLIRLRRSSDNAESDFSRASASDRWVDAAAITTWLAGANPFVVTMYDQTGNSRPATNATAGQQPALNMAGAHPSLDFDGTDDLLSVPAAVGFARLQGAASLIHVRKYDVFNITQFGIYVAPGGAGTRAALNTASNTHRASGRRLDATSTTNTTGVAGVTTWGVDIGRWDWTGAKMRHRVEATTETAVDPFQTAGNTSDTDSTVVNYGGLASASSPWNGQMTLGVFVRDLLTDTEVDTLVTSLAALKL